MPKTIDQMFDEKQKRIDVAIKNKEVRQSKTEMSIGFRWAVNCAINFLPEKEKGTSAGFKKVEKWYPKFMDLDRNYMIENMPLEILNQPPKLNRQDFAIAKAEAPKSQAEQDLAETLGEQKIKEDERLKVEENLPIIEE